VRSWQARLKKIFDLAGVSKGEGNAISHRFRDTFAVYFLLFQLFSEYCRLALARHSVGGIGDRLEQKCPFLLSPGQPNFFILISSNLLRLV